MLDSGRVRLQRRTLSRKDELPVTAGLAERTPLPEGEEEALEVYYNVRTTSWRPTTSRRIRQRSM